MKDVNGREIKVGDRVKYAHESGVTMWPAPPTAPDTVKRLASSTCVELQRGLKGFTWTKKAKGGVQTFHEPVFTFLACGRRP